MDRSAVLASKIRSALAPCSLGAWPTTLTAHPELARAAGLTALWLKREDLAGGNKVRGLEFLMTGAAPRSVFMTIGGAGSSHCLATARAARAIDCRCALAVFPQPETDASRHVAERMTETAQLVMRASSRRGVSRARVCPRGGGGGGVRGGGAAAARARVGGGGCRSVLPGGCAERGPARPPGRKTPPATR